MKIQRCKGTRDLSPGEMAAFRLIEKVFMESCLKWGYQEVRTPTIEYLHLFTSVGTLTPSMLGKVYSFLDWDGWSGERVVLRPDSTIPVARLYVDSMADKGLAKLFYVSNIFIFEETGKKTRERWQCGAELIGAGSPLADTELIALSLEIVRKLGLEDIELRISHAGLIKILLAKLRLGPEEQARIFDQIMDGDMEVLTRISRGTSELDDTLLSLLSLKGESSGFLKNLKALAAQNLPEIKPHLDDFIETIDFIESLGCPYKIDIASGAGFEYYTGTMFLLFSNDEKIGGGGRYDALIPAMGGEDIPASGFALYLDRLMKKVKREGLATSLSQKVLVRVKSIRADVLKQAFEAAACLREAGYVAEINLGGQEIANYGWVIDVHEGPQFVLWDKVNNVKTEAQTAGEVLTILGEQGADKDSLA